MDKTWKAVERRVAAMLNGRRTGPEVLEDVAHPVVSVEVKHREKLPSWLTAAYLQALKNRPEGKVPVVVLHEKNARRYLALLDLAHLATLLENDGALSAGSDRRSSLQPGLFGGPPGSP